MAAEDNVIRFECIRQNANVDQGVEVEELRHPPDLAAYEKRVNDHRDLALFCLVQFVFNKGNVCFAADCGMEPGKLAELQACTGPRPFPRPSGGFSSCS